MGKRKKLFQKERNIEYHYIVSREQPFSYVAEAFQKALVNIEFANVDGNLKVLQLTSSLAGAGKTTFISNMAFLLAKKNKKVVILDLDLRKPKVHRIFQTPNEKGLTDYLSGNLSYEKLVREDKSTGIDYIPTGGATSAVVNLLEAQKLKDLIAKLKGLYDYVLVDSPPVIAVSDALYISKLVDGVIFVVSQHEAKRSIINEAIQTLRQNNVNIIGTIFTQVNVRDSELYSYAYSYEYGYLNPKNKD